MKERPHRQLFPEDLQAETPRIGLGKPVGRNGAASVRMWKLRACFTRVSASFALVRHLLRANGGGILARPLHALVQTLSEAGMAVLGALQPVLRPLARKIERLPLILLDWELWAITHKRQIGAGGAASMLAVTAFATAPLSEEALPPPSLVVESMALSPASFDFSDTVTVIETIQRSDSMSALLQRMDLIDPQLMEFVRKDTRAKRLFQLLPGRLAVAEVDGYGRVQRFMLRTGGLDETSAQAPRRVVIRRDGDALSVSEELITLERSVEMREAQVQSSLFAATDAAGIPDLVASRVADIFGGEVDFHRDLRKGDHLKVSYETLREPGGLDTPISGRVLGAEFVNGGRKLEAYWFDPDGPGPIEGAYYSGSGESLRKAFLRNPVEFSRVSSGFSGSRLHPIFQQWRAHRGVDFAAPHGTRVRAAGDGTVDFVGWYRGYGNMVVIRHRDRTETVYAHLQSFAEAIRPGYRVQQGETLGEVGSTGWATGPHLHYELRINGEHVDPLTVAMGSSGATLTKTQREAFVSHLAQLRAGFNPPGTSPVARFE
ncbi:MAG: peptidoglycan DD-metalloendopeptidase family protein [Betaproteobacteria bacterium]